MAAETENTLSKVDSLVQESPKDTKPAKRRGSSLHADVFNLPDLAKEEKKVNIAEETQKLNWEINENPSKLDDKDVLKKPLCLPMVRRVDLQFTMGERQDVMGVRLTARNPRGVTINDALTTMWKHNKKTKEEDLELPVLEGFRWSPEEDNQCFFIHLKAKGAPVSSKKKKKGGDGE